MSEVCEQVTMRIDGGLTEPSINTDLRTDESYDFKALSEETRNKKAQDENLMIVYPEDNVLQIDIDNEHSYLVFQNQMKILCNFLKVLNWIDNPSKSGLPKRHITVHLDKSVTPLERIALQAMLGSDRIRELLGFIRLNRGELRPTCFFERKP